RLFDRARPALRIAAGAGHGILVVILIGIASTAGSRAGPTDFPGFPVDRRASSALAARFPGPVHLSLLSKEERRVVGAVPSVPARRLAVSGPGSSAATGR